MTLNRVNAWAGKACQIVMFGDPGKNVYIGTE